MSQVDRAATFRGAVVEHVVNLTSKSKVPQLVAKLVASEIWDEDEQQFVEWPYEQNEITAYLCLYGKDKQPTLTNSQIMKALKWDGQSFEELNNANYSDVLIQYRVGEHTYEGKTSLQVEWVDIFDAVPGVSLTALDADEIKKLDAQFAQFKPKATKVAASAPKAKPAAPAKPKAKPAVKPAAGVVTKKEKTEEAPVEEMPVPPTQPVEAAPVEEGGTAKGPDVWATIHPALIAEGKNGDQVAKIWLAECAKVGPDQKKFTGEEWYQLQQTILSGSF